MKSLKRKTNKTEKKTKKKQNQKEVMGQIWNVTNKRGKGKTRGPRKRGEKSKKQRAKNWRKNKKN